MAQGAIIERVGAVSTAVLAVGACLRRVAICVLAQHRILATRVHARAHQRQMQARAWCLSAVRFCARNHAAQGLGRDAGGVAVTEEELRVATAYAGTAPYRGGGLQWMVLI